MATVSAAPGPDGPAARRSMGPACVVMKPSASRTQVSRRGNQAGRDEAPFPGKRLV